MINGGGATEMQKVKAGAIDDGDRAEAVGKSMAIIAVMASASVNAKR